MAKWLELKSRLRDAGLADWIEDWDIKNIHEQVSRLTKGEIYLEIGVAHGASLAIANDAAQTGVNLYGIDVINWADREAKIEKFLGRKGKHEFIEGESQLWARYWKHGLIDVLFIDGDHSFEGVIKDMVSWIPWVKPGGTIMFDDYNNKERIKEAINELILEHGAFDNHRVEGEMYICTKR